MDSSLRGDIEAKAATLKSAMENDDLDALKNAMDELSKSSHKLAEQLYAQKSGDAGQGGESGGAEGSGSHGGEDVVDADFTEVK